ncbi:MAG TPA: hypothetical protein VG605_15035, partial [Puia sp.]|nr:hypothetical protein [Puia sp.]
DPELERYRDLFAYFGEEAEVSAGPEFGELILRRLGLPVDGAGGDLAGDRAAEPVDGAGDRGTNREPGDLAGDRGTIGRPGGLAADELAGPARVVSLSRKAFRSGVVAAAAAIVVVFAGLFLLQPNPGDNRLAGATPVNPVISSGSQQVRDTYNDPEQALAAVRQALLVVSSQLNESRRQVMGQIARDEK